MTTVTPPKTCGFCARRMPVHGKTGRFVRHNRAVPKSNRRGDLYWEVIPRSHCPGSGCEPFRTRRDSPLEQIECGWCGRETKVNTRRWDGKPAKTPGGRSLRGHRVGANRQGWQRATAWCPSTHLTLEANIEKLDRNIEAEYEKARQTLAQRQSDHDPAPAGSGAGGQAGDGGSVGGGFAVGRNSPEAAAGIRATGAASGGVQDAGQLREGGQDAAAAPAPEARVNQLQYQVLYEHEGRHTEGTWRDVQPGTTVGLASAAARNLRFRIKPHKTDVEILAKAREWLAHQDQPKYDPTDNLLREYVKIVRILRGEF